MNDYVALLAVIGIVALIVVVPRLRVWRRCRCGTQYCTGCGTRRQR